MAPVLLQTFWAFYAFITVELTVEKMTGNERTERRG